MYIHYTPPYVKCQGFSKKYKTDVLWRFHIYLARKMQICGDGTADGSAFSEDFQQALAVLTVAYKHKDAQNRGKAQRDQAVDEQRRDGMRRGSQAKMHSRERNGKRKDHAGIFDIIPAGRRGKCVLVENIGLHRVADKKIGHGSCGNNADDPEQLDKQDR